MVYAVIDVGSNSVRLMYSDGTNTLGKWIKITRLAEGLVKTGIINETALERTASAVSFFVDKARSDLIKDIFIFATAGVRQAKNSACFINKVKELTGINVDVISGEEEAKIGAIGALENRDGAIIDIGGASTEISILNSGKIVYNKSIDIGAVRLTERFGQYFNEVREFVKEEVKLFDKFNNLDVYGIGGTATSLAGLILQLEPYAPTKTHGYKLSKKSVYNCVEQLYSLSVEDRKKLKGMHKDRAEILPAGATILLELMDYLGIDYVFVSEKDNLEGYLRMKLEIL